ncbi:hypothetical protein ABPG72_009475 [Tetrahymena utriculariae]
MNSANDNVQDPSNQEELIYKNTEYDGQSQTRQTEENYAIIQHNDYISQDIQSICQNPQIKTHIQIGQQQTTLPLQDEQQQIKPKKSVSFCYEFEKLQQKQSSTESNQIEQIKFKKEQSYPGLTFKMPKQINEKSLKKSILKKSKTLEKSKYEQECDFDDELNFFDMNLDFYGIKNNLAVQNLTQKEQKNKNYNEKIFFSELAVKLSNSGELQQRIILLTQNSFYVLPNLNSSLDVKRFLITEINEIILNAEDSQICSLVIKNQFKLNIKLNHRKKFIQFILNVTKNNPNAILPTIYFKNSSHFLNCKNNNNYNNNFLSENSKLSKDNKQQFSILILDNEMRNTMNTKKIDATLLIKNNQITIATNDSNYIMIEKGEVFIFQKKDIQKRTITFQSINNHNKYFDIQLQREYDFPILVNELETNKNVKMQIK